MSQIRQKIFAFLKDERISEIIKGSAWALSSKVLLTLIGLVISIIIVRVYGAQAMGLYSVVQSFLALVALITVFGSNTSILRLIPEHVVKYSPSSAYKVYLKILILVVFISVVVSMFIFLYSETLFLRLFSKTSFSSYLGIVSFFIVFKSLTVLNTSAVRGLKKFKLFSFMQILPGVSNLILLLIFLDLFNNEKNPIFSMLFGLTITGIFGTIIVIKEFQKKKQNEDIVQKVTSKEIFLISLPMMLTLTMSYIIGQISILFLGMFASDVDVGYYSIAVKLATLTSFILGAINTMAGPKYSELFYSGRMDELFYVAKKTSKLVFWTTVPIIVGFSLFGKILLKILYGNEFIIVYPAMLLIILGQLINSIAGTTSMFMNMTGHQKAYRNIIFCSGILSIALNLYCIPIFGYIGAAFSLMLSISFLNIATLVFIQVKYKTNIFYLPGL